MNKLYIPVFLFFILSFLGCASKYKTNKVKNQFRVASYNIRYDAEADVKSGNGWELRKEPLAKLIQTYKFDIVGTQEGDAKQLAALGKLLPEFEYIGYPYGGKSGEIHNCATYYKKDLFVVLDSGVFWLSETPDEPSIGWDATDRRICHWTKFKERKSGKEFYFFNAHFYWQFKIAKEKSGPLMVQMIQKIAGDSPVICVGDFNSRAETPQLQSMKKVFSDAYEVTQTPVEGPEGTAFPGGVFEGKPGARIDYILVSNHFTVSDYMTLDDTYNNGHYPSDHLPITSLITLK